MNLQVSQDSDYTIRPPNSLCNFLEIVLLILPSSGIYFLPGPLSLRRSTLNQSETGCASIWGWYLSFFLGSQVTLDCYIAPRIKNL